MVNAKAATVQCCCQSVTSSHHHHHSSSSSSVTSSANAKNGNGNSTFCNVCIQYLLASKIQAHKEAQEERNRKRAWCAREFKHLRRRQQQSHPNRHSGEQEQEYKIGDTGTVSDEDESITNANDRASKNNMNTNTTSRRDVSLDQLQDQILHLTQKLKDTTEQCGQKSIALATTSMQNSQRAMELNEQREVVGRVRGDLDRLRHALVSPPQYDHDHDHNHDGNDIDIDDTGTGTSLAEPVVKDTEGSLRVVIFQHVKAVKQARFRLALQAFQMHRIDIGSEYNSLTMKDLRDGCNNGSCSGSGGENNTISGPHSNANKTARFRRLVDDRVPSGIGKICGLLFPHRGPSHFSGVLPHDVLASALRFIASVVNTMARCLSIELPHPIVLNLTTIDMDGGGGICMRTDAKDIAHSAIFPRGELAKDASHTGDSSEQYELTLMKDLENLAIQQAYIDGNGECVTAETSSNKKDGLGEQVDEKDEALFGYSSSVIPSHGDSAQVKSSNSTTSLLSLVGSSSNLLKTSARKAFGKMTGTGQHEKRSERFVGSQNGNGNCDYLLPTTPMDERSVSERLKHATYVVLYENSGNINAGKNANGIGTSGKSRSNSNGKYLLKPPLTTSCKDRETKQKEEEDFATGLLLLQNNIIALSIKTGVPVAMLWPAEAMLLNLNSLKLFCMSQLEE